MKSNYKKLGGYIQAVNNRNKGLISKDLQGLSMSKEFRKSTSNIIGTDLTKYKLVYKNQFACDFMSIIRVHKFPVVLHDKEDPVIVSPAYTVFKISNEDLLDPEYLMMWFRRSEYDRYADFRCDSAIRGGFKWEELCESELPIPTIEKQREIVKEYNTVVNRIKLNEQLNQKLEETAQALYKHWFVDFEFPNEDDKPYKSSGGKMVLNAELEKDIPEGWSPKCLDTLGKIVDSLHKTPQYSSHGLPMVRVTDINAGFLELSNTMLVGQKVFDEFSRNHKSQKGDIVVSRVGATFGEFSYAHTKQKFCLGQNTAVIIPKSLDSKLMYTALTSSYIRNQVEQKVVGSAYSTLSLKDIRELKITLPDTDLVTDIKPASNKLGVLFNRRSLCCQEITCLKTIQQLILSKMTKI